MTPFERITIIFKAMMDGLLGKIEDPQAMLETPYAALQTALASGRQKLVGLLAIETQLQRQIEALEKVEAEIKEVVAAGDNSDSELSQLKLKLSKVQAEIADLKRILSELVDDVGRSSQVLRVRDAANKALHGGTDAILAGKAITEEGFTFDREISSTSVERQKEHVPKWLLVLFALILFAFVGFFAHCYVYRN